MEPIFESFDSLFDKPQEKVQNSCTSNLNDNSISEAEISKKTFFKPFPKLSKIKPVSACKRNIVLLLYGSFYPIHNNHIRTLRVAQNFIESSPELSKIYHVLGSFIMPTHLNSLKKKIGKPLLENDIRLELIEKALEDEDGIDVLSFLSKQKTNIGIHKAKKFLSDYLNMSLMKGMKRNQKITVTSVLGDDNLEIVEKNLKKRELFIIVQNRPHQTQKDLSLWLNSEKISPYKDTLLIVKDETVPYEISSTEIRNLLASSLPEDQIKIQNYLPSKFLNFFRDKKIAFPNASLIKKPEQTIQKEKQFPKMSFEELIGFKIEREIPFESLISKPNPQKLGEGLQAAVLSMTWRRNPKELLPVAVKITKLDTDIGRKLKTYIRDLRALLLCNHNNVVRCYGAGMHENSLFTVMERGLGFKTWNFIQEQRKSWENKSKMPRKWFKYLGELAEGLHHMSERGVLHRDLQLNNIVVFERGEAFENEENKNEEEKELNYKLEDFQLKVCDFGVSALESDKHLIVRGSTRHYSPEALEDKVNYVSASDVYSFGNMLYEIINARKTFTEYTVEQMQIKVKMGERPNFIKGSDLRLKEIIEKCWLHDWKKRPTFLEVSQELFKIYEETKE